VRAPRGARRDLSTKVVGGAASQSAEVLRGCGQHGPHLGADSRNRLPLALPAAIGAGPGVGPAGPVFFFFSLYL
jgi:hypothetical protein